MSVAEPKAEKGAAQLEGKTAPTSITTESHEQRRMMPVYQGEPSVNPTSGRRINPDSLYTLWFTVILICTLGLTSFMVSFNGLHDVAGWVGLPVWLRWAVPIFIDIAILAYSLAAVIHRARGETVWPTWTTLGVFTLLSVIANGAHALSRGAGTTAVQSWIGAGIAGMAPVAVFAATEQLSRLAFATNRESRRADEAEPSALVEGVTVPEPVVEASVPTHESVESGQESESEGSSRVKPEVVSPVVEPPGETTRVEPAPVSVLAQERSEQRRYVEATVAADEPVDSSGREPEPVVKAEQSPVEPARTEPEEPAVEHPAQASEVGTADDEVEEPRVEAVESAEGSEEERLVAWVTERRDSGEPVTGAAVGEFLGRSARTGRNRLKALQQLRPDLFEGAE